MAASSLNVRRNATLQFDQTTTDGVYDYELDGLGTILKTGSHSLTLSGHENVEHQHGYVRRQCDRRAKATLILNNARCPRRRGEESLIDDDGASLTLNFSGEDTLNSLFIDGGWAATGTWGAVGSGAAHTSSLLAGTGILNVTAVPEPSTLVLALVAIFSAVVYAWRRRK